MTKLSAIIRPSRLDAVKRALHEWGVGGLSVAEVHDDAEGECGLSSSRGAAPAAVLAARLQVEVVVPTPLVPRLLDVLTRAARTGKRGDGSIRATPVEAAIRIRTGERGEGAL